MRHIIFANGEITDYQSVLPYLAGETFVIACDGGLRHVQAISAILPNFSPDYIIGDFDSASPELLQFYQNKGVACKTLPTQKDETDLELAIDFALSNSATEIFVFGGISVSRFDHTMANVHVLYRALSAGVHAELINENDRVFLINTEVHLHAAAGSLVSLLPFSDTAQITTTGLKYPLRGEVIRPGSARGISNVFKGGEASVRVTGGVITVVLISHSV